MKHLVLPVVLIWGAVASAASAQDAFTVFKTVCIDTRAQQEPAISAAAHLGWEAIAADRLGQLASLSDVESAQGRVTRTPDGAFVLVTGLQTGNDDPRQAVHVCSLHAVSPRQPVDAITSAQAWVGVPPMNRQGAMAMWQFVLIDGAPVDPSRAPDIQTIYQVIAGNDPRGAHFEIVQTARYE